jgi:hypothetical protein
MNSDDILQFCLLFLVGQIDRNQQLLIDYLLEEIKVLREQLGWKPRFTDRQRVRLAAKAKDASVDALRKIVPIVTPETLLRWRTAFPDSNLLVITINPLKRMRTKIPECWASDPNARAVRIELSAEQSLLLPFDQFAFSELKTESKGQRLRLVFATHEISLRGHSLRRIETAIQRMELSLLTRIPEKQRTLIVDGQPIILDIIAKEAANCGNETTEEPRTASNLHRTVAL